MHRGHGLSEMGVSRGKPGGARTSLSIAQFRWTGSGVRCPAKRKPHCNALFLHLLFFFVLRFRSYCSLPVSEIFLLAFFICSSFRYRTLIARPFFRFRCGAAAFFNIVFFLSLCVVCVFSKTMGNAGRFRTVTTCRKKKAQQHTRQTKAKEKGKERNTKQCKATKIKLK